MSSDSRLQFTVRRSEDRGQFDKAWLRTFHTFSFDEYKDNRHTEWGALRVINEDFIAKGKGFGEHAHEEFEIWTYMIKGELTHRDSLGHVEVLQAGDVQYTSAGTGIKHSEGSESKKKNVHLLQIWAKPTQAALKPSYYTRRFPASLKTGAFLPLLVPASSINDQSSCPTQDLTSADPIPCFAELGMSAALVPPRSGVRTTMHGKRGYLHVCMRSGYVAPSSAKTQKAIVAARSDKGDVELKEGDGMYITGPGAPCVLVLENVGPGDAVAEVLFFDL